MIRRDEPLEYRLHHVAFARHPKYAALSYTWDGQTADIQSRCNGKTLLITQNCHDFLRQLRSAFAGPNVYLWVDQICIDQKSSFDKSVNVREMGAIYQQATTVLVWTGSFCDRQKAEDVVAAAEKHGDLGAYPYTIAEHWVAVYGLTRSRIAAKPQSGVAAARGSPDRQHQKRRRVELDALVAFRREFQHISWFQRMWTFQEAIVPEPHRVYFILGKYTIPFDILNDSNYGTANEFYGMRSTNRQRAFADLVQITRNRQCLDPRDKYFGLYSVLRLMDAKSLGEYLEPDYDRSTKDIYIEGAYWALIKKRDTRFLYLAVLSDTELAETTPSAHLPSWVPDPHRLSLLNRDSRASFFPEVRSSYHAAPSSICACTVSSFHSCGIERNMILHIRGIIADEVEHATDEIVQANLRATDPDRWQRGIKQVIQELLFALFDAGVFNDGWMAGVSAFWRTVACTVSSPTSDDRWWEQCLRYVFSEKASLSEETKQLRRYRDLIRDGDGKPLPTHCPREYWPPYLIANQVYKGRGGAGTNLEPFSRIFEENERRTLFLTKKKRIGIAHGSLRKGDKCAIASGCCKVLILRPVGQQFCLVGHGFIDGLMSGESWPQDGSTLVSLNII
ncbi:heterokaryon incompatibility protein-domain-containing protein [Xylariaceae sp. FL1272]|nr:heterokaryon incompatibility protein-domain-containing protein [Xylariaceae sp. FL1272]